jgi:hypothetical protein
VNIAEGEEMWVDKTAADLVPGDELLSKDAVVEVVVPCGKGASVYLGVRFHDDGYYQTVTVPADRVISTWVKENG